LPETHCGGWTGTQSGLPAVVVRDSPSAARIAESNTRMPELKISKTRVVRGACVHAAVVAAVREIRQVPPGRAAPWRSWRGCETPAPAAKRSSASCSSRRSMMRAIVERRKGPCARRLLLGRGRSDRRALRRRRSHTVTVDSYGIVLRGPSHLPQQLTIRRTLRIGVCAPGSG